MKKKLLYHGILLAGVLAILLPAVAGCTSAPTQPSAPAAAYTVKTASKADLGAYLVDARGMTLYYLTRDTADKSSASAIVIALWPVFYVANIAVPPDVNASDFGTITRDDGKMQTTYKGWPLYYYIRDLKAGDTNGQGIGGIWFVVNPETTPSAPNGS